MPSEAFVISVWFPADEAGLNYLLRIDDTGQAELTAESNELNPDIQAVGIYSAEIGATRALELRDTLVMLDRRGVPASTPLPPGSDIVVISLEQEGAVTRRMVDPSTSTPAMCKVADDLRAIAERAQREPVRVITMESSVPDATVSQDHPLLLTVRLEAQGKQVVKVVNPIAKDDGSGQFTVWAVRSDLPPAELWPQHSRHQSLQSDHLMDAKMPPQDDPALLVLQPSEIAAFEFQVPVDWETGKYDLRVIFESLSSQSDVLKGKIISVPVTLTVM